MSTRISMNESSGANTVLIVLLIIIVLGAIFWFATGGMVGSQPDSGAKVEINLPGGSGQPEN